MRTDRSDIPAWLTTSEHYRPGKDRDGFVFRNILALTSMLEGLRLDATGASRLAPCAMTKIVCGLIAVVLVSLARNYFFVLVMLAGVLVRACLLPRKILVRVARGAAGAAVLVLLVTLPALLIGQSTSALMLATKTLVSCAIVLTIALTTPHAELTSALRGLRLPSIVILTIDLTLHSIVSLGERAAETLSSLRLRSVGRNRDKQASMAGVGGSVLLRAAKASHDTHDAMCCRGFDGTYRLPAQIRLHATDALWIALTAGLIALFIHLQGA